MYIYVYIFLYISNCIHLIFSGELRATQFFQNLTVLSKCMIMTLHLYIFLYYINIASALLPPFGVQCLCFPLTLHSHSDLHWWWPHHYVARYLGYCRVLTGQENQRARTSKCDPSWIIAVALGLLVVLSVSSLMLTTEPFLNHYQGPQVPRWRCRHLSSPLLPCRRYA